MEDVYEVQIKEGDDWVRYPDQPNNLSEFEANAHMAAVRCLVDGSTELRVQKSN